MAEELKFNREVFNAKALPPESEIMAAWQSEVSVPSVSVVCPTFNHYEFIEDALKGFLIQKTHFPFEVLIHDDASSDGTSRILREYAKRYPNIIKPVIQDDNLYSKGVRFLWLRYLHPKAKGKYIALCEGDDFWFDEDKLRCQFRFLEAHPDYSICAHAVDVINTRKSSHSRSPYKRFDKTVIETEDVISGHFIPTLSIFCRNQFDGFLDVFDKPIISGDKAIAIFLLRSGKGHFDSRKYGVYRMQDDGITNTTRKPIEYVENMENLVNCSGKFVTDRQYKLMERELSIEYVSAAKKYLSSGSFIDFIRCIVKGHLINGMSLFHYVSSRVRWIRGN